MELKCTLGTHVNHFDTKHQPFPFEIFQIFWCSTNGYDWKESKTTLDEEAIHVNHLDTNLSNPKVKSGKPTNIYHFLKHSTGKQVKEMLFKEEQKQLLFHILWKTSSSFSKLVGKLVQNLDKSSFAKVSLFRINLESLIRCISMKWRLKGQGISN